LLGHRGAHRLSDARFISSSPSMAAYQDFMEELLQAGLGIEQYYSLVVTKPVKSNSPIPLSTLRQR
ncbi:hypothetical protein NKH63_30480, partial [Mesorhizobium sp. M0960]